MSNYTPVKVETALPTDFYAIATLESRVFFDDPFCVVAFGPNRTGEAQTQHRAESLGKLAKKRGETATVIKATLAGEIVGSAVFAVVTGRKDGGDELIEKVEERKKDERWGPGANIKFCEDVFIKGDGYMMASCGAEDYAKLSSLVVAESHQRMGIGSQLLEVFLAEADALGLQAVLGASKLGRGLYKRYGFTDYYVEELKMWEYEGGEGMEADEQVIMHRTARIDTSGNLKMVE